MSSSKLLHETLISNVNQPKNKIIFALKDFGVYFRRTFLAGFGSLICIYGGCYIASLSKLPEKSKQVDPIPVLLKYRYLLITGFGAFAVIAFSTNKYFLWRTISKIELRSGGKEVAFKALNRLPLRMTEYSFQVPLSHVSCIQSRRDTKAPFVRIRIKGKPGSYYIDKEGYFPDPMAFDYSIGVQRKI